MECLLSSGICPLLMMGHFKCPLQQAFHLSKHHVPFFILFLWYLLNFIGKEWKTNSAMLYRGQGIPKMNPSGLGFSEVLILGVPQTPSSGITLDFSMWPLNSNPITATDLLQYKYGRPTTGSWLWTWRDFHNYFEPTWHRANSPYSLILLLCTFP